MSYVLGMNAKLYALPSATTRITWDGFGETMDAALIEVGLAMNVTLNIDMATADVTTRGNNGWRATVATLRDATLNFDLLWDDDHSAGTPDQTYLGDFIELATGTTPFGESAGAAIGYDSLGLAVLDGPKTPLAVGDQTRGLWASWVITSFPIAQELESGLSVSVAMRPTHHAVAPEWLEIDYQAP